MTITAPPAPPVPSTAAALYDARHTLGSLGRTGHPLACAALLRAVSTVEGLALREVAAVDADGGRARDHRVGSPPRGPAEVE